jgi:thiol-disulfide isomerase/thioredoxin
LAGLLGGAALFVSSASASETDLKHLAQCISESGAEFYGAYWCPYCHKQNQYFGEYADLLPYIECSEKGSRDMITKCERIMGLPTWKFATRIPREGVLTPETLAKDTGCPLTPTSDPLK